MCALEINLAYTVYGLNSLPPTPLCVCVCVCVLKCDNHWRMKLDLVRSYVEIYESRTNLWQAKKFL
jgi:hypothetical protein